MAGPLADTEPMIRPLGPALGAAMRRRHEAHGVHFHLGHTIDAFHGDDAVRSGDRIGARPTRGVVGKSFDAEGTQDGVELAPG